LIKDCALLTPALTIEEKKTVAVCDAKIAAIGDNAEGWEPGEVLDGRDKLLMPGLVDGHTHTCQQLLRGKVADEFPMIWARFLVPFESVLTEEDVYHSARLSCLEMIKAGTTSFIDSGGRHMHRVADAAIESGIRAAIARSTMDVGGVVDAGMLETPEDAIARTEDLYRAYHQKGDGRIEIWFALRQVMTCSPKLTRLAAEKAKEYHTGLHAHLYEHKDEVSYCLRNYKMRPAEFLDEMGALGPNLLTAHNIVMAESDISLYARRQVKAIHCPHANLTSHGFPKTPHLLANGISIGLGSDGSAGYSADLFEEMRTLRLAVIAYWGLPAFDPVVLRCAEILKMATQGGAAAMQHTDTLGTIAVGKKADMILVSLRQPHLAVTHNMINTLVESASGRDVTDSIINGKLVMKGGVVLTLDEQQVIAEARRRLPDIAKRAGF
jgi:5-methylthioadenosine/S-adenosylhomocysteine deaminase